MKCKLYIAKITSNTESTYIEIRIKTDDTQYSIKMSMAEFSETITGRMLDCELTIIERVTKREAP